MLCFRCVRGADEQRDPRDGPRHPAGAAVDRGEGGGTESCSVSAGRANAAPMCGAVSRRRHARVSYILILDLLFLPISTVESGVS